MVWCGMVWYGMVWYGMVWYGMVRYGMVWYDVVIYYRVFNFYAKYEAFVGIMNRVCRCRRGKASVLLSHMSIEEVSV